MDYDLYIEDRVEFMKLVLRKWYTCFFILQNDHDKASKVLIHLWKRATMEVKDDCKLLYNLDQPYYQVHVGTFHNNESVCLIYGEDGKELLEVNPLNPCDDGFIDYVMDKYKL